MDNQICKKCGEKDVTKLIDVKIKNEDLGQLCNKCYPLYQDDLITAFKTFTKKQ